MLGRIVVPPNTLVELADLDAIDALAVRLEEDFHFVGNIKQLLAVPGVVLPHGTPRREVDGIMRLADIKWIKHEAGSEIVAVVPLAIKKLLDSRPDLKKIFSVQSLSKLVAGKYRSHGELKDDVKGWMWLKEGPPDPLRWLVGAHRSAEAFAEAEARIEAAAAAARDAAAAAAAAAAEQRQQQAACTELALVETPRTPSSVFCCAVGCTGSRRLRVRSTFACSGSSSNHGAVHSTTKLHGTCARRTRACARSGSRATWRSRGR